MLGELGLKRHYKEPEPVNLLHVLQRKQDRLRIGGDVALQWPFRALQFCHLRGNYAFHR
jgi:hypothetical protein